jgi:hypothetical protein
VVLSISAAALFGIALAAMLRFGAIKLGGALVASLFGFYLAGTGIAPSVNHAVLGVFHALTRLL